MLMRWPVCLLRHDDRQLRMVIRIWGTPIADLCGPLTRVTNARLRPDRAVLRGWAAPAGEPVDMSSVLFAARRLAGVSTRKVRAGRAMEPAHVSQSHPPAPSGPCSIGDATATSSTSTRTQASSPWGIPATRTGTEPRPGPSWEPGRRLTSHLARGSTASTEPVKLNETSGCWIYLTGLLGLDGGAGLVDPDLGGQGRG